MTRLFTPFSEQLIGHGWSSGHVRADQLLCTPDCRSRCEHPHLVAFEHQQYRIAWAETHSSAELGRNHHPAALSYVCSHGVLLLTSPTTCHMHIDMPDILNYARFLGSVNCSPQLIMDRTPFWGLWEERVSSSAHRFDDARRAATSSLPPVIGCDGFKRVAPADDIRGITGAGKRSRTKGGWWYVEA
jgi:hypothetical protein